MQQMQQQEQEYDIYFQGSKQQLFAMLYPLTGPSSPIFDHLEMSKLQYNGADRSLHFSYDLKDFSNIDKKPDQILYESTSSPTHSNYFYSTLLEDQKALVWRSVNRMVELRPVKVGAKPKDKQNTNQHANSHIVQKKVSKNDIQQQNDSQLQTRELQYINVDDPANKIISQIQSAPFSPLNRNWDISKQEYLSRLCE